MSESTENRLKAFLERNRNRITNNTHRSDNDMILSALDDIPQEKIEKQTSPPVNKHIEIVDSRKMSQERSLENQIELIEKTIPTKGIEEMSFEYQPVSLFDVIGNVSYGDATRFSPKEISTPDIDFVQMQQAMERESQINNSPEKPIERKLDKEFEMINESKNNNAESLPSESITPQPNVTTNVRDKNKTEKQTKNFAKKTSSSISIQVIFLWEYDG